MLKNKKVKKINRMREPLFTEEDFKPENIKIRISMMIPLDLQEAYRAEAERLGIGYQTLMQMKLREGIDKSSVESRLEKIEEKLFSKHG